MVSIFINETSSIPCSGGWAGLCACIIKLPVFILFTECQCFLAGVVNNGDCAKEGEGIREPGDCYCKINVMGKQCDMCRPGYYNLSEGNPDGCQGMQIITLTLTPPLDVAIDTCSNPPGA